MTVSEQLRLRETEKLMLQFMAPIQEHYREGARSPMMVLEVLNALAFAVATVLGGTIDDKGDVSVKAEAFFSDALRDSLAHIRRHPQ